MIEGYGFKCHKWRMSIESLCLKWPEHVSLVHDVPFKLRYKGVKERTPRKVLVISTFNLNKKNKNQLTNDLISLQDQRVISFPAWPKATHLFLRVKNKVYDNGFYVLPGLFRFGDIPLSLYRFKVSAYQAPKNKRIEPTIWLSESEFQKLEVYLLNIQKNRKKTLGKYNHQGDQMSLGQLDDNHGLVRGHNCTSWLTTAPLGSQGEALLELLGATREIEIGTNPGWWYRFIMTIAPAERVPYVLYWSPQPLQEILKSEVKTNKVIEWDYLNR